MLLFVSRFYFNEIMLSIDFAAVLAYQLFSAHNALRMHMIFLHNTFFWNNVLKLLMFVIWLCTMARCSDFLTVLVLLVFAKC